MALLFCLAGGATKITIRLGEFFRSSDALLTVHRVGFWSINFAGGISGDNLRQKVGQIFGGPERRSENEFDYLMFMDKKIPASDGAVKRADHWRVRDRGGQEAGSRHSRIKFGRPGFSQTGRGQVRGIVAQDARRVELRRAP